MANIKVPNQYTSGEDTFSDNLVGFQIVDGSSQMTATSFAVDRIIPEKDSKTFQTQPFSDFLSLDSIGQEDTEVQSTTSQVVTKSSDKLKFNPPKNDGAKSLYGSLRSRLSVTVQNVILKFPAAMYVDSTSPIKTSNYTADSINYDLRTQTTTFEVQKSMVFNPLDIIIEEPEGSEKIETTNTIRNFYSSYKKYVVEISGTTYNIVGYTEPNISNVIILEVQGDCFSVENTSTTGYSQSYLIRPNNGVVEEFYNQLDELESILVDRETIPKYLSKFRVPKDLDGGSKTELTTITAIWPTSKDGWNIQITGLNFNTYVDRLSSIGTEIDNYKSNLIIRFLTAPQLFEFDTEEQKSAAIFQIYGQSFDKVKKFIDNIAYMRNVTYDKINNLPDILLKNLSTTLGFTTPELFDEKTLEKSLYSRTDTQYIGLNLGKTLEEAEFEFYRRILVNLAHLYKSKGTRLAIEFFLKFIGAPEPIIKLDEYLYRVDGTLPTDSFEDDIREAIQGDYVSYTASYTGDTIDPGDNNGVVEVTGMSQYIVVETTGTTSLTRAEYPVDEDGRPRGLQSSDGSKFFQLGAGWYRKTLEHRSHDILDTENSDLTGRTKTIKTMSKPFTYGEDYFDYYRNLPGLDYGYELTPLINNEKIEIIESEEESKFTLNRKNINIFLSSDRAVDYDIYTKSRNLLLTFGELQPPTGKTFAEFLSESLSEIVQDSNVIKYKKYYRSLDNVYNDYKNSSGFTPYNYIKVNEFITRMSPFWTNVIDQFVPATTLWLGGNVIENGLLNRSKFQYKKPCVPVELIENLYPDFCGIIEEDLETILGGGTTKGIDVAQENFRSLFNFNGYTYVLYIDVNGRIFTGATESIVEEIISGFTPTSDCTSLEPSTTSIPLICDYKEWLNCDSDGIKEKWLIGIQNLVDNINNQSSSTGVSVSYEIFTENGVEKIKFTSLNEGCVEGNNIDFYFEPSYDVPRTECDLRVEVMTTPGLKYIGEIDNCQLNSDLYITVVNNNYDGNGGFVTGIESGHTLPHNLYVTTGTTCSEQLPCLNCDPLYTWNQYDSDTCYTDSTTGATAPDTGDTYTAQSISHSIYSEFGTKLFGNDYNTDGTGIPLTLLTGVDVWENVNSVSTEGPLNRCALWTTEPSFNPVETWLGYSICLTGITETKTYYVGTGADNHYRIVLDGVTLLDSTPQGNILDTFKFWHVYPVEIGAGEHILEIYGKNQNPGSPAGFGCEVYDNTFQELVDATTYSDLDVLLTTSDLAGEIIPIVQNNSGEYIDNGYTCPEGYTYSPCNDECTSYLFCESEIPTTIDVHIGTNCDIDETSIVPVETTVSGCTYLISGATENNTYDIIVGDASNSERKFRIEGLQPKIETVSGVSGYTLHPKIQYKSSDDFGIRSGTTVYKEINSVPLITWENLSDALSNGDVVEVNIENVSAGDIIISITPKETSDYSISEMQTALTNNSSFDFTFTYKKVEILNVECLSSIKKNIVNEEFEILPTSKLYVYTNINENLEKVPFHFTYKYPEDLYIKSETPQDTPCCVSPVNYLDVTDRIINQYGFLIDVTSVNLNYCDGGIYFRLSYEDVSSDKIILFNGSSTGSTRVVVSHEKENFECLNMKLQHYFTNDICTDIPTIEELERNTCLDTDCEPTDCEFDGEFVSSELENCLTETVFIIQYNTTLGPCPGGHGCDCATFNLLGNTTNLGTVYLSNTGGNNDIFNYPEGETSGSNRYNEIMLSSQQAQEISESSIDGMVEFSLECALNDPSCNNRPTGCHEDVTWIKMVRDGELIYEGCPEGNFIKINPCSGEIGS